MSRIVIFFSLLVVSVSCQRVSMTDLEGKRGENPCDVAFSWKLESRKDCVMQEAWRMDIATSAKDLRRNKLVWSSGRIVDGTSLFKTCEGAPLEPGKHYFVKITAFTNCGKASETCGWYTGLLPEQWGGKWIGSAEDSPAPGALNLGNGAATSLPVRYLRKEFEVEGGVREAVLYVCGLGASVCHINGVQVGDDMFGPLHTWYPESCDYLIYDVTELVKKGDNVLAVELGNGRYYGMWRAANFMFGLPRLMARLKITCSDGEQVIVSDQSWKLSTSGPIAENNEYDGETYFADREFKGWTCPGFDDNGWSGADVLDAPGGVLRAQVAPCQKVQEILKPVAVWQGRDGKVLVDMGQNFAGIERVTFKGRKGVPVTMRFAEVLADEGDAINLANIRNARVTDTYVPAEDGGFTWQPEFVYHGFRYMEISGLDYLPDASDIEGLVVYDEMETTGAFECSDPVINAVTHNAFWGIRSNYHGIPTDCPQRDERHGWLGDHAVGALGESYFFDNERMYSKWMCDIEECMSEEGWISNLSPRAWDAYRYDVTWPSAYFYITGMLYEKFGNLEIVKYRYDSMRRWMKLMQDRMMEDNLIMFDKYGDWCMPPEGPEIIHSMDPARQTCGPLIASAVFYDLLGVMGRLAEALGKNADAAEYGTLANAMKLAFNKKWLDREKGCYDNNTVTANVIPLQVGLVPDEYKTAVVSNIVDVTTRVWDTHVSSGVLGMSHLMRGLTDNGAVDLAVKLASTDTYPSFGYMAKKGATTIWELWNGDTADPAMNSHNHIMLLGDYVVWLYEDLAGIRNTSTGFKSFELRPVFPDALSYVNASYDSPYGEIVSNWSKAGGKIVWDVTIPANTVASLVLPQSHELRSSRGGAVSPLASDTVEGGVRVSLGGGSYHMVFPWM